MQGGCGVWVSGRAFVKHTPRPGCHSQHCKTQANMCVCERGGGREGGGEGGREEERETQTYLYVKTAKALIGKVLCMATLGR